MSAIVISEEARIPAWVTDHRTFRRWIYSGKFPERGQFFHLNGELWVDLSMESLDHNQIKGVIYAVICSLVLENKLGRFCPDGMMLTNLDVLLSTEPDGIFLSRRSLQTGQVRLKKGGQSLEVIGTPDMVLEVVSKTTINKDTVDLLDLYFRAGIAEYWLVDSRPNYFRFDIYRPGRRKYVAARKTDGWIKSDVFGKSFKLTRTAGAEDTLDYRLEMR